MIKAVPELNEATLIDKVSTDHDTDCINHRIESVIIYVGLPGKN